MQNKGTHKRLILSLRPSAIMKKATTMPETRTSAQANEEM